jgi:hypothetical protein
MLIGSFVCMELIAALLRLALEILARPSVLSSTSAHPLSPHRILIFMNGTTKRIKAFHMDLL